jgi:hypothetical protein
VTLVGSRGSRRGPLFGVEGGELGYQVRGGSEGTNNQSTTLLFGGSEGTKWREMDIGCGAVRRSRGGSGQSQQGRGAVSRSRGGVLVVYERRLCGQTRARLLSCRCAGRLARGFGLVGLHTTLDQPRPLRPPKSPAVRGLSQRRKALSGLACEAIKRKCFSAPLWRDSASSPWRDCLEKARMSANERLPPYSRRRVRKAASVREEEGEKGCLRTRGGG